ncbi:MAG: hypothetical protein GW867_21420 [Armatimonadetes bacterium]|nr:hypothetical protein [Armatimonadota bacterium]
MAWHDEDMQLAAKYGIIQTTGDTVGPGGLSAALRIVPLYVEIAEAMDRLCPDAILLNHSNPMVPICRAINKYTGVCVLGLCHGAQGTEQYVAEVLGIPREELSFRSVGVNHMLWMTDIRHRGRDVYPLLRGKLDERGDEEGHLLARKLFDLYGYYPVNNDRHIIEFFPFLRQARAPGGLPYKLQFRSEMLAERKGKAPQEWEERRKRAAGEAEINLPKTPSPENVGALIGALATGAECKHLVNIPNNGAAPNMPDWAVVEIDALLTPNGPRGVYMGPIPQNVLAWTLTTIYQQELVVDAAVKGDRTLALQALVNDPQVVSLEEAEGLLADLLEARRAQLPRFFPGQLTA